MMTTRLPALAAFVAAAALANQAVGYTAPPEDPISSGGGEELKAEYIGCFYDNTGDRVLGDKTTSSDMTTAVRRRSSAA